jgi:hypothetical protein
MSWIAGVGLGSFDDGEGVDGSVASEPVVQAPSASRTANARAYLWRFTWSLPSYDLANGLVGTL